MKVLLFCLFLTPFSFGQIGLGEIKGTVFDNDGEPAIFVKVLVVNSDDTNRTIVSGTESDFDGKFYIRSIQPGQYDLTFYSIDHDTLTVEGVVVKLEQITFLDELKMHRIEQIDYDFGLDVPYTPRRTIEDPFGRSTIIDPEDIRRP